MNNSKIRPDTEHPAYEAHEEWVEVAYDAFKAHVRDPEYVAKLSDQSDDEYRAYVDRAPYLAATERTVQSLIGVMMRNPYTLTGTTEVNVSGSLNFDALLQDVIMDIALGGRVMVVTDIDDAGLPYIAYYPFENIINWSDDFVMLEVEDMVRDAENPYQLVERKRWKELFLADTINLHAGLTDSKGRALIEGAYYARYWEKEGKQFFPSTPIMLEVNGAPIFTMARWWANPYDNEDILYMPPILTVAELNIAHFRLNCDLYHGLHFLGLPTFVVTGDMAIDEQGNQRGSVKIGSTKEATHLAAGGSASFVEFTGTGLSKILEEKKNLEEQMSAYGAHLIAAKTGVESVEAIRIRAAAETSVLETMSNSIENALNSALELYSQILGVPTITVALNNDFVDVPTDTPAT